MASAHWFRSRQIVCVTAGCLMLVGQAWGQSSPPALLGTAVSRISPAAPPTATGQFVNRVFRDDEGEHKYVVFVPVGYSPAKPGPVILYLHGASSRGTDGRAQLVSGLGAAIKQRQATFPFLAVFPQCENIQSRMQGGWTDDPKEADRALKILDAVEQDYSVDKSREILVGLSMGGTGAWNVAARTATRWSALVVAGGGGKVEQAVKLAGVPVWAFHALQDPFIPINVPQEMVATIRTAGGRAFLSEIEGRSHDISGVTFTQPALQEWLLDPKKEPQLEGLKWENPVGYKSGLEEEMPFVPGAEVSQAVRVRLCNDVLESFAYALPAILATRPMSRSLPGVHRQSKIGFVPLDLSLSGLHFQGHVERAQLVTQPPDRLMVRLGLRNVTMTVSRTQMNTKVLVSASAGPMHVVIGHREPVWLTAVIRPRVENRQLKFDVVGTDFRIPDNNWYVTEPSDVHVRGLPMLNGRVSDGMVNSVYNRKGEIEQQVIGSIAGMVQKAEATVNQMLSRTVLFEKLPLPIWQPRLRPFPESVRIDQHGVTLTVGTTFGVLGHPEKPLALRKYAPVSPRRAPPITTGAEIAISDQMISAWTELIVAGRVNYFNSADFHGSEFRILSDPKFLQEVIPDLKRYGDNFEADIAFLLNKPLHLLDARQPGPLPTSEAVRTGNGLRLSMSGLRTAVSIRQPGEKSWKPCANFDLNIDRDYQPQILQGGFAARAVRLIPTSEVRCEVEGKFAPGYEPQTPGIDVPRFVSQVMLGRDGAQKEGNKPVPLQDLALGGVPFRMEEFTWSESCLVMRAKIPAIVVTNDTDKPMTFETRGPFTDWTAPLTLAAGEHSEFKVPYPLTWRRRLPTTTLFYTLPIGREASVRDAPTPGVVLIKDEIDLADIADAPRAAHLEVPAPVKE